MSKRQLSSIARFPDMSLMDNLLCSSIPPDVRLRMHILHQFQKGLDNYEQGSTH